MDELVKQALQLDPENADVWDLQGDLLAEMGRLEEARDAFAKVLELRPGNVIADKKHARMVFGLANREFEKQQMEAMILSPGSVSGPIAPRKPALAFLLSAVIPGAGQLYNGQMLKGGILIASSVLLAIYILASPAFTSYSSNLLNLVAGKGGGELSFGISVAIFLQFVVWAYAIADAIVTAGKLAAPTQRRRMIDLPADFDKRT